MEFCQFSRTSIVRHVDRVFFFFLKFFILKGFLHRRRGTLAVLCNPHASAQAWPCHWTLTRPYVLPLDVSSKSRSPVSGIITPTESTSVNCGPLTDDADSQDRALGPASPGVQPRDSLLRPENLGRGLCPRPCLPRAGSQAVRLVPTAIHHWEKHRLFFIFPADEKVKAVDLTGLRSEAEGASNDTL